MGWACGIRGRKYKYLGVCVRRPAVKRLLERSQSDDKIMLK